MIKRLLILVVLFAAAGCSKVAESGKDTPRSPQMRTVILTACIDKREEETASGKAAVSDAGALTWQTEDKIAVLDDGGTFREFTLASGAGTDIATFEGSIPAGHSATTVAVFPWRNGHSWSASEGLSLSLPSEYSVAESAKALMPMIADFENEGDDLHFRHVGGLIRLTLQDIPSDASSVRLSSYHNQLSGSFPMTDISSPETSAASVPTIEQDTTVTVNFSRRASEMDFYIPLPAVVLNGFTVDLYDSSGTLIGRKRAPATMDIPRGCYLRMPPVSLTPVTEYQKIKFIEYNVLQGMINDYPNNMDNFVAWVKWRAPDILVICEGKTFGNGQSIYDASRPMPNNISNLAARWGHPYYMVGAQQDNFPVLITSRYPIELLQRLQGAVYTHGGLHVRIAGFDLAAIHLFPDHTAASDEEIRLGEITAATGSTIHNAAYSSVSKWILTGDMNSYYRGDNHGSSTPKEHNLAVQDYIHSNWDHDVLYEKNGGQWMPTMYHGGTRIDYFYVSDAVYPYIREARVLHDSFTDLYTAENKAGSSDHRPLQVVYERVVFSESQNAGVWDMIPVNGAW